VSTRRVLDAFAQWRAAAVPLVLLTVVETEGSTYSKAGHRIVLTGTGEFQGLVSGGCLEGDLAGHAREVLAAGRAQLLTYDLRDDGADIFGLGIGCNGLFRLLLQPLLPASGYAPFAAIAAGLLGDTPAMSATVVRSNDPALPAGATLVTGADGPAGWELPSAWQAQLMRGCTARAGARRAELAREESGGREAGVLYAALRPLPRLLVLGAGLDAVPLIDMASRLGWRVTVADHRPAQLARGDLGAAGQVLAAAPGELPRHIDPAHFTAAVVMTHHLDSDRAWLAALSRTALPYIGLLGPAQRRARLLAGLGPAADALGTRLHGPAGLAIGADSPEAIALAVLAEIHAVLAGRLDLVARSRIAAGNGGV